MNNKTLSDEKNFRSQLDAIRSRYNDLRHFATACNYAGILRGCLSIHGVGLRVARVIKVDDSFVVQSGHIQQAHGAPVRWSPARVGRYSNMNTAVRQGVKMARGTF